MVASTSFDSNRQEAAADGVSADTELRADLLKGVACVEHGNYAVNVQSFVGAGLPVARRWWGRPFAAMTAAMFRLRHYFKVRHSVVQRVTIHMVDDLPSRQLSTEMAFHDHAVLVGQSAFVPNHPVAASFVDMPTNVTHGCMLLRPAATFKGE